MSRGRARASSTYSGTNERSAAALSDDRAPPDGGARGFTNSRGLWHFNFKLHHAPSRGEKIKYCICGQMELELEGIMGARLCHSRRFFRVGAKMTSSPCCPSLASASSVFLNCGAMHLHPFLMACTYTLYVLSIPRTISLISCLSY